MTDRALLMDLAAQYSALHGECAWLDLVDEIAAAHRDRVEAEQLRRDRIATVTVRQG
jgi:hypothetical protein